MDLKDKRIVLVGGAGFVGSHIVDQLCLEPVREIIVFDNFVRGTRQNLDRALPDKRVRVVEASMTDRQQVRETIQGADGVFLLALALAGRVRQRAALSLGSKCPGHLECGGGLPRLQRPKGCLLLICIGLW